MLCGSESFGRFSFTLNQAQTLLNQLVPVSGREDCVLTTFSKLLSGVLFAVRSLYIKHTSPRRAITPIFDMMPSPPWREIGCWKKSTTIIPAFETCSGFYLRFTAPNTMMSKLGKIAPLSPLGLHSQLTRGVICLGHLSSDRTAP